MAMNRRIRWLLGALAVVLLLAAGVYVTGMLLPERHRAEARAVIRATPEQVYALISDVERFPAWRSDVTRVEVESREPELRYREYDGSESIVFVIDSAVPNERWVARIADLTLPFGGRWVFTLRPDGAGTELRIAEEGEVRDPFFRFMSRFVIGHDAGVEQYLDDVRGWFDAEAGR